MSVIKNKRPNDLLVSLLQEMLNSLGDPVVRCDVLSAVRADTMVTELRARVIYRTPAGEEKFLQIQEEIRDELLHQGQVGLYRRLAENVYNKLTESLWREIEEFVYSNPEDWWD